MTYEEKSTWVSAVVTALVAGGYAIFIAGRLGSGPVEDIAYQVPLLVAIGAVIVLAIVGNILMSIGAAVGAEIAKPGASKDIDRRDERDERIDRRGELVGYYVMSAGALGVLALAMLRFDQFWIANALFLTFMVGGLVASAVKLVAYRRGF